jgi:hypothetical protein
VQRGNAVEELLPHLGGWRWSTDAMLGWRGELRKIYSSTRRESIESGMRRPRGDGRTT